MRRSHLQTCRGTSISDLTHKNKLFRELKLFYSKLKVVGQTLMKTKIDFILNGLCEFFLFFWRGGGGGVEIARRQVSENKFQFVDQHFAIMLSLCDSIYGVSVSVVKIH